jgi:hypothetical protein
LQSEPLSYPCLAVSIAIFLPDSTVLGSPPSRPPSVWTARLQASRPPARHRPCYRSYCPAPARRCCPRRPSFAAGGHHLVGPQRRPSATVRALQLGSVPRFAGPIERLLVFLEGSRDQGGERLGILRVRMGGGFHSELSQRRDTARDRWNRGPESSSVPGWSLLGWAGSMSLAQQDAAAAETELLQRCRGARQRVGSSGQISLASTTRSPITREHRSGEL